MKTQAEARIETVVKRGLDFRQRVAKEMEKGLPECMKFCMSVVNGKATDYHVTSQGKVFERPASLRDRLSAIKMFKELAVDKVLPDMKQTEIKTEVISTKDILEEIAKKKRLEAEKIAEANGKLKRVTP